MAAVLAAQAAAGEPPSLAARRAGYEEAARALGGPGEPVAEARDVVAAGVGARVFVPASGATGAWLAYFHGGGWALGSPASFDAVCRALANASGATVVSADYRLAPEHPFPAALEDSLAVARWAAEQAGAAGRLCVAGDSAGGNLAAVAARRMRDDGAAPGFLLLVYPVLDAGFDTPSYRAFADGRHGLSAEGMRAYWEAYLDGSDPHHPDASPLRGENFAGLPPAFILTSELDVLRDEGEAYARALERAGVPVTLRRYEGAVHGFWRWQAVSAAARRAAAEAGAAVRAALP